MAPAGDRPAGGQLFVGSLLSIEGIALAAMIVNGGAESRGVSTWSMLLALTIVLAIFWALGRWFAALALRGFRRAGKGGPFEETVPEAPQQALPRFWKQRYIAVAHKYPSILFVFLAIIGMGAIVSVFQLPFLMGQPLSKELGSALLLAVVGLIELVGGLGLYWVKRTTKENVRGEQ